MEEYKKYLINNIYSFIDTTMEEVENSIKDKPNIIVNRNEEGKIHSHYLGDRYKPAIIWNNGNITNNYYLFDGDIKDCIHPFRICYCGITIVNIRYYSSERIKNEEPIYTDNSGSYYNKYNKKEILSGYESKYVSESNSFKDFTLLCNEIVEPFKFEFVD